MSGTDNVQLRTDGSHDLECYLAARALRAEMLKEIVRRAREAIVQATFSRQDPPRRLN